MVIDTDTLTLEQVIDRVREAADRPVMNAVVYTTATSFSQVRPLAPLRHASR